LPCGNHREAPAHSRLRCAALTRCFVMGVWCRIPAQ
jgi:hypothetical protein